MATGTETLIIGGGAIGICCAYYLNEIGKKVIVVEKGDICSGSSYGNAGLIVPSYSIPLAAPGVISQGLRWMLNPESPFYIKPRLDRQLLAWLWKFQKSCNLQHVRRSIPVLHKCHMASLKLFDELAATDGLNFALEKKGMLELFGTETGMASGVKDIRLVKEYGIENRVLQKKELDAFTEGIYTTAVGGAYLPHDAHLIPDQFVQRLARNAEKRGVELLTECEVLDFKLNGRRATGVETTRGRISAEEIVVAGGAWSTRLARALKYNLSVQPAKGYSITFNRPPICPSLPVALAEVKVVLTPMADTLRFAGTLVFNGMGP